MSGSHRHNGRTALTVAATAVFAALLLATAAAAKVSDKLVLQAQFGAGVNLTEVERHGGAQAEDLCVVQSGDTCQGGVRTNALGGFNAPESVAVGPESSGNDVYVADSGNKRIEVFKPNGEFLRLFDWGPIEAGEPLGVPESLAVDQATGDLYILDRANHRVDEYTPTGEFVWMIGGDVNKTKTEANAPEAERNLCTAASHDVCQPGATSTEDSTQRGAIDPAIFSGNLLAVGGPEGLLYVGDQGRIQEFEASTGVWKGEVPLESFGSHGYVEGLAVDGSGDLYVAYSRLDGAFGKAVGVQVLTPAGTSIREIDPGKSVTALALDPFGRLAVVSVTKEGLDWKGELFEASSGIELGEFGVTYPSSGVAFNPDVDEAKDELYVAVSGSEHEQDVEVYGPAPIAELETSSCGDQSPTGFELAGEVNPRNVADTSVWFEYGKSAQLGSSTAFQYIAPGEGDVAVRALVADLLPNETYDYRLVGEDANYHPGASEPPLAGATLSCATSYVAPEPVGEPASSHVTFSSAVLSGEVNPENARTEYGFEYGPCPELENCPEKSRTPALESTEEYGAIGATQSVAELAPGTTYRYRLFAENENAAGTQTRAAYGPEGSFTTAPAPSLAAATGPASAVTSSSAVLNGTVDPDGEGATYAFQVGVYNGAGTVFTTIVQGATGSGAEGVGESFALSGLQPGVQYAYRIVVSSAYGSVVGEAVLFTTPGLPSVLFAPAVLAQLPIPSIAFPRPVGTTVAKSTKRGASSNAQKLAQALAACKRKPRSKRAACERQARKRYPKSKQANDRKKG